MLAHTLDWFLEDLFRLPVRKALDPNDPSDFAAICNQLAKATQGLVQGAEAKALKAALDSLDVDWKGMNAATKAKVVLAAKQAVNPVKSVLPKVEEHFEANALKLGMQTKGSTKKTFGFSISPDLTAVQVKSLQAVAFSSANYVRDEYGKRSDVFGLKAKQIVVEELAKGTTNKEIAERLRTELAAQQFNRSQAYWAVVANAFANRARVFTNLSSYQEAGIIAFRVVSVLDERTSHVCRFMHGKQFPVESAMKAYDRAEEGEVKQAQPWVSVTTNDKGQEQLYITRPNGARTTLATVTQSGMGQVDEPGKFSGRSNASLEKLGVMTPPFHGHCRTSIEPVEGMTTVTVPSAAAPPPEAPEPPPFALTPSPGEAEAPPPPAPAPAAAPPGPNEDQGAFLFGPGGIAPKPIEIPALDPTEPPVKAKAKFSDKASQGLEQLLALKPDAVGNVPQPANVKANPLLDEKKAIIDQAFLDGLAKKGVKEVSKMKASEPTVDPAKVAEFLKNPKLLQAAELKVVKIGNESYVVDGHEAMAAAQLSQKWKLKVNEINLKQLEDLLKEKAKQAAEKPAAPPIPPKPVPAPVPPPPPPPAPLAKPVDPANILHNKYGAAQGSNEGGFYEGADGVKRYVKFYKDEAQAHGEVLANALYKALGHEAPEAVTWKDPSGKQVYAAKLLDGQTLGSAGVTKTNAKEFFKGFAADVLSANWDAAGMSVDNAFLLKNGKVARIDNGGCFLMRAKEGRKPESVLNAATELDYFFPGSGKSNPGYHKLAQAAGYNSVEDFKDDFKKQVAQISAVKKQYGSWDNFVSQYAPGFTGKDRKLVVDMLEARHKLLEAKVEELYAPPPPKPLPGQRPAPLKPGIGIGYQAPEITGVPPRKGLKPSDLPSTKPPEGYGSHSAPSTLPSGEDRASYQARALKSVANITPEQKKAISDFTDGDYGEIRDSEERGKPNKAARDLLKAFEKAHPEPGTTYRGIKNMPDAIIEKWLEHDGVFRLGKGNVGASSSTAWHAGVSVQHSLFMGGTDDPSSSYKVLFQIRHKSGIPIEKISAVGPGETEVLIPSDAEFRIKKIAKWQGKQRILVIELEEI